MLSRYGKKPTGVLRRCAICTAWGARYRYPKLSDGILCRTCWERLIKQEIPAASTERDDNFPT